MKNTLLTYKDCVAICDKEDSKFYESRFVIDGYNISIFNYRLAMYNDFEKPLNDSDINAFEMRGLTFVFDTDGTYKRYLLMGKFFNINQTNITSYHIVKDYEIDSVYNKEDGSLITFIKLPNGRVLAKSKTSFESEQAIEAQSIYNDDENLKTFVDNSLDNDIIPIFEYVSPFNKIVLNYNESKLVLLKLRDNVTGEYLDISSDIGLEVAKQENYTLDEMMDMAKIITDKEGWVILFKNGLLLKIKTVWYFEKHRLLTDEIWKENIIIGHVLNETIDDVISQIDHSETTLRGFIEEVAEITNHKVNVMIRDIKTQYSKYMTLTRKEYALGHKRDRYFPFVVRLLENGDMSNLYNEVISSIIAKTNKLEKAREWLNHG